MPSRTGQADDAAAWLGVPVRIEIDPRRLGPGLGTIDVVCRSPRYVTLGVDFEDAAQASLQVGLDALGVCRYRKAISLDGRPSRVWIELRPGDAADLVSLEIAQLGWRDLAAFGWRAARAHLKAPGPLLAKARQALAGGSSMVFSPPADRVAVPGEDYARWRDAFEADAEAARLLGASDRAIGRRPFRVLAVALSWRHGGEALAGLAASLRAASRADVHVLDLGGGLADGSMLAGATRANDGGAILTASQAVVQAMARTEAEMVVFLERPGCFHSLAVACLGLALARAPEAAAAYGDHDHLDGEGQRIDPVFKPAWSLDYQLSCDYIAQPVAFRADPALLAALDQPGALEAPSFALLASLAAERRVEHVPRVLFHCSEPWPGAAQTESDAARLAIAAANGKTMRVAVESVAVAGSRPVLRVRYGQPSPPPLVSVIIPTKDNAELLARAWRSVTQAEGVAAELIVVDNGASTPAQLALLADIAATPTARVVAQHGAFNFSRLINAGRSAAKGQVLVLLNDDVEATETGWLAELAAQASRPGIGCVGALLLYPDGRVQHAGVLLGINGGAGHAFRFLPGEAEGSGLRLKVAREVSAVTAACLAVQTSIFDAVGGFSEDLPVTLNDVDFCLKVQARGNRNLFTPFARLMHREATSRGLDATPEKLRRLSRETAIFRHKWGRAALEDPFHSPHASPGHEDFRPRRL